MSPYYPLKPMPSEAGIYALKCRSNGKIYIGKSINLNRRYAEWKGAITGGFRVSNSQIASMLAEHPDWDMVVISLMPGATKEELARAEYATIKKIQNKNPKLLLNNAMPSAGYNLENLVTPGIRLITTMSPTNVVIMHNGKQVYKPAAAAYLGVKVGTLKKRLRIMHRSHGITQVELDHLKIRA